MLPQRRRTTFAVSGALFLCGAVAAWAVDASTLAQVRKIDATTPRDVQIAIAVSAGPPISDKATVYVLGPQGYEVARQGTNGFSCLVERQPIDTVAPVCYDAEGTATLIPVDEFIERERARGRADADIAKAVTEGYRTGQFKAPRKGGIAYMLSDYNWLVDPKTKKMNHFPGHLMFYAPNATADDVGHGPGAPILTDPGQPDNFLVVVPAASHHAGGDHQ
ncbi:MAG TPA: hypothetical protein VGE98_03550 [Thermoanaerobaculia bacterium]